MAIAARNPQQQQAQPQQMAKPAANVAPRAFEPSAAATPASATPAAIATAKAATAPAAHTFGEASLNPLALQPKGPKAVEMNPGSMSAGGLPDASKLTPQRPNPLDGAGGDAGPQQNQASNMWADMLNQSNQQQSDALQSTYADEALNARRASEQNASMGGGVGGGFAGGQAQAQLAGTQQRLGVRQNFSKQQMDMKGAYLQTLIKQAEAAKDRDLQSQLQAELDKTNLQIAQMGVDKDTQDSNSAAAGFDATTANGTTLVPSVNEDPHARKMY